MQFDAPDALARAIVEWTEGSDPDEHPRASPGSPRLSRSRPRRAEARSLDVEREVDPRTRPTASSSSSRRHAIAHAPVQDVKGTRFPLVTNVCGSMGRLAMALDCPLKLVGERYAEAVDRPIAPGVASQGPCTRTSSGASSGSRALAAAGLSPGRQRPAVHHGRDRRRARSRDRKANLSYHRLMIAGKAHTGIFMERGKHLDRIHRRYSRLGQPMPIAVFIGVHPLVSLGSLYSGSADVEEYDVIGGLMGAPLPLVRCLTQQDLSVPAHAEMVLEGVVPPDERDRRGPVRRVHRLRHRHDPDAGLPRDRDDVPRRLPLSGRRERAHGAPDLAVARDRAPRAGRRAGALAGRDAGRAGGAVHRDHGDAKERRRRAARDHRRVPRATSIRNTSSSSTPTSSRATRARWWPRWR